jgi:hypothetical protein
MTRSRVASRCLAVVLSVGGIACAPVSEPRLADTGSDGSASDDASSSGTTAQGDTEADVGDCDFALPGKAPLNLHAHTGALADERTPPSAATCGHDGGDGEDIVFSWVAPTKGLYRFAAGGATSAPLLAVFADCSRIELLGCAHATHGGGAPEVAAMVEAGQQIALLIDDTLPGGSTEYFLTIAPP